MNGKTEVSSEKETHGALMAFNHILRSLSCFSKEFFHTQTHVLVSKKLYETGRKEVNIEIERKLSKQQIKDVLPYLLTKI
jgi:hypothetical protein